MNDIIKSFKFNCENVELTLNIKKEINFGSIKIFIDGNLISNNSDLNVELSTNISSVNFNLYYLGKSFFWMSSNKWKGMRWESYRNETKYAIYRNLDEMRTEYIKQRHFIDLISNHFYHSLQKYKSVKLLYETQLDEIYSEEESNK